MQPLGRSRPSRVSQGRNPIRRGQFGSWFRFHQAAALSHVVARYGLPATVQFDLHAPAHVPGIALTPGPLARDTDILVLRDWVTAVRG